MGSTRQNPILEGLPEIPVDLVPLEVLSFLFKTHCNSALTAVLGWLKVVS